MTRTEQTSITRTTLACGASLITLRGSQAGPTLALLGGVHGDEDEGVLAVHRVLRELDEAPLAGTVRAVAPANLPAWAAQSRSNPLDAADLARTFPGDRTGSPTARAAAAITEEVIDGADALIDLHSAGVRYQMPLLCGFLYEGAAAERSRRAAIAFGAPLIWLQRGIPPGRSLSVAAERGIASLYAECTGGGGICSKDLDAYVHGVLGVMVELGMLPESYRRRDRAKARWVYGGGDFDKGAQYAHYGFFVSSAAAGAVLTEGEELGRIYDFEGHLLDILRAPARSMLMFLRRQARIRAGEVLYALAQLEDTRA